mmetsp:Transcript_7915/g.17253  ORF Transcript_7915/g.17253 Transcript_7915/m.17253 type:complete len:143 (-) Transcript_7915:97-525(-)
MLDREATKTIMRATKVVARLRMGKSIKVKHFPARKCTATITKQNVFATKQDSLGTQIDDLTKSHSDFAAKIDDIAEKQTKGFQGVNDNIDTKIRNNNDLGMKAGLVLWTIALCCAAAGAGVQIFFSLGYGVLRPWEKKSAKT